MSKFSDVSGLAWTIEIDCFMLDRVEKEAGVDLADLTAGGLLAVERDAKALGRVLAVVCADQCKERGKTAAEFVRQIRKDAITRAREAVLEAVADFFPQNEWCAMQSSLEQRKSRPDMTPEQLQLAAGFMRMDPEVQKDVMGIIQQEMDQETVSDGSSPLSEVNESAPDPEPTPPSPAESLPENAEQAPEGSLVETSG